MDDICYEGQELINKPGEPAGKEEFIKIEPIKQFKKRKNLSANI